jgi:hypothetical protein
MEGALSTAFPLLPFDPVRNKNIQINEFYAIHLCQTSAVPISHSATMILAEFSEVSTLTGTRCLYLMLPQCCFVLMLINFSD